MNSSLELTFAGLTLEQAVGDELGAVCLQAGGQAQGAAVQSFSLHLPLAAELRRVEGEGGEQQPRVVVDVGLDEAVAVADPDGHHGVHCDAVGGQVAGGGWGQYRVRMKTREWVKAASERDKDQPVGVFLSVVAAEAQVEVLADVAVDPAAYDQALAVVAGVFHVHHLVVVLVALGLGAACSDKRPLSAVTSHPGRRQKEVCELTEEAGLAQVHVHALEAAVAVPRCHPLTAVTGDHHVEQVAVAGDEHVHLEIETGQLPNHHPLLIIIIS